MKDLVQQLQKQKEEVKRKRAAGHEFPEERPAHTKSLEKTKKHGVSFEDLTLEKNHFDAKKQSLAEWDQTDPSSPTIPINSMNATPNQEGKNVKDGSIRKSRSVSHSFIKKRANLKKSLADRSNTQKKLNQDLGIKTPKRSSTDG